MVNTVTILRYIMDIHYLIDDNFLNLPVIFTKNEAGDRAIVVELPGPFTVEAECNYIALYKDSEGALSIYTSEYYASDRTFGLCKECDGGMRFSLTGKITDLNSFLNLINQKQGC